jgi:hypothetical protein
MADLNDAATVTGNFGHGWVHERPDGLRARCGGPGLCPECSIEAQRLAQQQLNETPHPVQIDLPDDVLEGLNALVADLSGPLVMFAANLAGERDSALSDLVAAHALNNRLIHALAFLVKEWPQTSWGGSEQARDTAEALLDEIRQEGATMGSPEQPTRSGDPAPNAHTDTPRPPTD